mmetsp:Transcript_10692/g.17435  ORF Transcript_10692/g.17435 Transcript_10692/m.17435 type:complete len:247 (+) Transcript_10692:429-1169(+)
MRFEPCWAAKINKVFPYSSAVLTEISSASASSIIAMLVDLAASTALVAASSAGSRTWSWSSFSCRARYASVDVNSFASPNRSKSSEGRLRESSSSRRMFLSTVATLRSMSFLQSGTKMLSMAVVNCSGTYLQASTGEMGMRKIGLFSVLEDKASGGFVCVSSASDKNPGRITGRGSLRQPNTCSLVSSSSSSSPAVFFFFLLGSVEPSTKPKSKVGTFSGTDLTSPLSFCFRMARSSLRRNWAASH